VEDAARSAGVEAVAVANTGQFESLTLQRLAWSLERSGIDLLVAPDVADVAGPRIRVAPLTGLPLLHITEPRVDGWMRRASSLASRLVAVPLLIAFSPLLLLVAAVIKVVEGGPVLYRQERIGLNQQPFHILKFRTMVTDADNRLAQIIHLNEHDGALFKIKDDPRVTSIGKWLRKFSIDELPQLINVVCGDMVFVGPRPVLARETARFGEAERRRFNMKPGITGLWQVSGRSSIPWDEAVKLDLYYVENWSPALDLLILLRTLWVVLAGDGM
jgi:exopolysaccharide biosynthesis polyprenyl glycosylphosphotransferase